MLPLIDDSDGGSEDELFLDNIDLAPSPDNIEIAEVKPIFPRTMRNSPAAADVFDIETTFGCDGTTDSKKRRKTGGDANGSPRKKVKEGARRHSAKHGASHAIERGVHDMEGDHSAMLRTGNALETLHGARYSGTQAARENVLMPPCSGNIGDKSSSDGHISSDHTIQFGTDERQVMLELALQQVDQFVEEPRCVQTDVLCAPGQDHSKQGEGHLDSHSSGSIPWSAEPFGCIQTPSTNSKRRTKSSPSNKSSQSTKSPRRTASEHATHGRGADSGSSRVGRSQSSGRASKSRQSIDGADFETLNRPVLEEQYYAKPSRSRSKAIDLPQQDWSIPPERLARKRKVQQDNAANEEVDTESRVAERPDVQLQFEAEISRRAKAARDEDSSGMKTGTTEDAGQHAAQNTAPQNRCSETSSLYQPETPKEERTKDRPRQQPSSSASVRQLSAKGTFPEESQESSDINTVGDAEWITDGSGGAKKVQMTTEPAPSPAAVRLRTPTVVIERKVSTPQFTLMPPPASTASLRKKRATRSHTTIFEDHVSPRKEAEEEAAEVEIISLKQQQATRKKRGRPIKQSLPEAEPAEHESSATEPATFSSSGREDPVVLEVVAPQSIKKGRGRAKKTQVDEVPETQQERTAEDRTPSETINVAVETEEDLFANVDAEETHNQKSRGEGTTVPLCESEDQAPSLSVAGKETEVVQKTTPKVANGKQMHSPIKRMASVHRVGLSRRQSIQPLLKTLKRS